MSHRDRVCDHLLAVRISADDQARILSAAEVSGQRQAEWVRDVLRRAAERVLAVAEAESRTVDDEQTSEPGSEG